MRVQDRWVREQLRAGGGGIQRALRKGGFRRGEERIGAGREPMDFSLDVLKGVRIFFSCGAELLKSIKTKGGFVWVLNTGFRHFTHTNLKGIGFKTGAELKHCILCRTLF